MGSLSQNFMVPASGPGKANVRGAAVVVGVVGGHLRVARTDPKSNARSTVAIHDSWWTCTRDKARPSVFLVSFLADPPPSYGINLRRPPQTSLVYQPRRHATSRCVALRRAASLAPKASSWRPPLDRRFNGKSFLFRDMGRVTNKQLRHSALASPWRHSSNCLRFAGLNSLTNRLFYDDVLITRRYPKEISARDTSGAQKPPKIPS